MLVIGMAFFTLEDRAAEIECVAFARQYAENGHLIRTDNALCVSGTISLREDEPPKILVNAMEQLIDDAHFTPKPSKSEPVEVAEKPSRATQTAPKTHTPAAKAPTRLFLRVPSTTDGLYYKALNLAELFDGEFPAYFYFADEKRYDTVPHGIAMSDYVLKELIALLGADNVILK